MYIYLFSVDIFELQVIAHGHMLENIQQQFFFLQYINLLKKKKKCENV